jgi:predicted ATPase
MKIKNITIKNFKSIKNLEEFKLNDINILIGANGAGKSNFISFLKLLREISKSNLQRFVADNAGANRLLHFGRKNSESMGGRIEFDSGNAYEIELKPDSEDSFYFVKEITAYYHRLKRNDAGTKWIDYGSEVAGYKETNIDEIISKYKKSHKKNGIPVFVKNALSGFEVYHFHDTGKNSPFKLLSDVNDNRRLQRDGKNIASFLLYLKEKEPLAIKRIEGIIRQIAPFFDSFTLEPLKRNPDKIKLEWKEKGSDDYFNADQLSDGTLRMIALTTLLLQPNPPATIIIDEPELGLHPAAIQVLAGLIRSVSKKSQVIISTQSVTLINQFVPEDLIIVERENNVSVFKRLSEAQIEAWLDNYSIGEVWEKNIIGGRP